MTYSRAKKDIDREWLERRYVEDLASVAEIAKEADCSVNTIRKWLKKWSIHRGYSYWSTVPAWNKGLTKEDDERLASLSEARSGEGNPMHGKPPWNKGKSYRLAERGPLSDEHREKLSEAKKGLRGKETNHWKGGMFRKGDYDTIRVDGVRKYLHRHIAETLLMRELAPCEEVHHMDLNRKNNDPKNLLVLRSSDHTSLHSKLAAEPSLDQLRWLDEQGIVYEEVL